MKDSSMKKWVIAAGLAGVSYLLRFIAFPIIPLVPYLKIEFADVPVLLGFFALGLSGGLTIGLLRSVLFFIVSGVSLPNLIDASTEFISTLAIALPVYLILRGKDDPRVKDYLLAGLAGTAALTLILAVANVAVIMPAYISALGMQLSLPISKMVLYGVIPFNLLKGASVIAVFALVYAKIHGWLSAKAAGFKVSHKQF
ncbi:membrane protein [Ligilactobacillus salitolerans]|uniref:Riboflavin transporter n=1 Tax=Ligilactobacillus salitolerans TaxID=1808352 RepID=A0A401IU61_9LACO|nr:ECF transporter S component [Ligilactobacillus salitolerans]GBG95054.1 membrane protein [Ligilactobacillus salitolerans]